MSVYVLAPEADLPLEALSQAPGAGLEPGASAAGAPADALAFGGHDLIGAVEAAGAGAGEAGHLHSERGNGGI